MAIRLCDGPRVDRLARDLARLVGQRAALADRARDWSSIVVAMPGRPAVALHASEVGPLARMVRALAVEVAVVARAKVVELEALGLEVDPGELPPELLDVRRGAEPLCGDLARTPGGRLDWLGPPAPGDVARTTPPGREALEALEAREALEAAS